MPTWNVLITPHGDLKHLYQVVLARLRVKLLITPHGDLKLLILQLVIYLYSL